MPPQTQQQTIPQRQPPVISPPPTHTTPPPKSRTRRAGEYVGGKIAYKAASRVLAPYIQPLVAKLNQEIEKGHDYTAFSIMMLIASFKDFLDVIWDYFLAFIQAAIVIGQVASIFLVVLKFLISVTLTLIIIYFMFGKGWLLRSRVRWAVYLLWFFDFIPAVDLVPMESLGVLLAWRNVRQRAVKARRKLEKVAKISKREAEALAKDITRLDLEPAQI